MKKKAYIGKRATAIALSVGLAGSGVLSAVPAYADENPVVKEDEKQKAEAESEEKTDSKEKTESEEKSEQEKTDKPDSENEKKEEASENKEADASEDKGETSEDKDTEEKKDTEKEEESDEKQDTSDEKEDKDSEDENADDEEDVNVEEKKDEKASEKEEEPEKEETAEEEIPEVVEEEEENSAAKKKLAKMIKALPEVSEIEDKTEEELAKIQEQLDKIADFMEENDLELDDEQQEVLNTLADALNQRMTQLLADTSVLQGECGDEESDVQWELTENGEDENGKTTYKLTISGTGAMENLNDSTDLVSGSGKTYPWLQESGISSAQITEIVIEDGVTSIGAKAFIAYSNVESISIGKDVREIGTGAINQLKACEEFDLSEENPYFTLDDQGALYDSDMKKLYALPCQSEIENYVLPDSVEVIGYNAFAICNNLLSVEISKNSSLTTVGFGSFAMTDSLEEVKTFPKTVKHLGTLIFSKSNVKNVYCADETVKEHFTSDSRIVMKSGVRLLTEDESPMEEYVDEEGYTWLLNYPEAGQALLKSAPINEITNADIPDEIQVGENSYTVTEIGEAAFAGTKSFSEAQAGKANKKLISVTIPYTVKKIDEKAFYCCANLERIDIEASAITIDTGAFNTYAKSSLSDDASKPTVIDLSNVKTLTDLSEGAGANGVGVTFVIADEAMLDQLQNCENNAKATLKNDDSCYWIRRNGAWVKQYNTVQVTDNNGITWTCVLSDEGITLTKYEDREKEDNAHKFVVVPDYLEISGKKYPVVKLGNGLFGAVTGGKDESTDLNLMIRTLIIPDTVTETKENLVRRCFNLEKVSFQSSELNLNGVRTFSTDKNLQVIDLSSVEKLDVDTWNGTTLAGLENSKVSLYVSSDEIREAIQAKVGTTKAIYLITNGGTIDITDTLDENTGFYQPEKPGYTFAGWYEDADFSGTPATAAEAGMTYYAKWEEDAKAEKYTMDTSDAVMGALNVGYTEEESDQNAVYKELEYTGDFANINVKSIICDNNQFDAYNVIDSGACKIKVKLKTGMDVGSYSTLVKVVAGDGTKFQFHVSAEVTKNGTTITAGDGGDQIEADYGDNILLTAKIHKQASDSMISTFALPIEDSIDFYCGETLLGTAMVKYDAQDPMSGTAKLIYDTGKKGIPAGAEQTITASYGGSGELLPVEADIISVLLNKKETSVILTADSYELTGAGSVELEVDTSSLPYGAEYVLSCDDAAITALKQVGDTYAVQLPDLDKIYTFTVKYAGNEFYDASEDSASVTVKSTQKPEPTPQPTPEPTPAPETPSENRSSDRDKGRTAKIHAAASNHVTDGNWSVKADGTWEFRKADGSKTSNEWLYCMWNGTAQWYRFNEQGDLLSGWFTDADGSVYYLHDIHDGNFGAMYTGWHKIQDKWYYFSANENSGRKQGALVRNGQTPDGYEVDENGVWKE